MPRRGYERQTCKACGAHRSTVGHVTWRGYCIDCGKARHLAEVDQMRAHSGPFFEHWRRRGAASYGAVLLDDVQDSA